MVTDGLNPFTVLAFLGAVLGGGALAAAYVFARITGRQPLAKVALVLGAVGAGAYLLPFAIASVTSRRPKDASLSPNSRYVALVDAEGRQYPGPTDGLTRRLIPGESYTTDIVFDVPTGAADLRLVLRNDDFETSFLIGHENSLFHGRTMFALPQETDR